MGKVQTTPLPLKDYDLYIVSFSGGKDSIASLLYLLACGVDKSKVQLWHQEIDGDGERFMDWPVTRAYCKAFAEALGLTIKFQWKQGGFEGELNRKDSYTRPNTFELQSGDVATAGGISGNLSTRGRFPQTSADLSVRWCSAYLKIDVAAMAVNNDPDLKDKKILFITGERGEESTARSKYFECERHRCHNKKRHVDQFRPVLHWSEEDVWSLIQTHHIQPHPAYMLGYGRVSCQFCIFGDKDQWATGKAISPEAFEKVALYETQSGITIKIGKSVLCLAEEGTSFVAPDNEWVAIANGTTFPVEWIIMGEDEDWIHPTGAFKKCGGPV